MSGVAHRRERVEESPGHAGLTQPIEALPQTEALGQSAPASILDAEDVECFEKEPVIHRFAPPPGKAGAVKWTLEGGSTEAIFG